MARHGTGLIVKATRLTEQSLCEAALCWLIVVYRKLKSSPSGRKDKLRKHPCCLVGDLDVFLYSYFAPVFSFLSFVLYFRVDYIVSLLAVVS